MHFAKALVLVIALRRIACSTADGELRHLQSADGPCEPGELVFVGFCNLCLCNSKGVPNQLCAKSWCRVSTPLPSRRNANNLSTDKPFA